MNPFRFLLGGWHYSLSVEVEPKQASRLLDNKIVDSITDTVEGLLGARQATHLLAGKVSEDIVYLYVPRYVRWPMWPLTPVFWGHFEKSPDGGSVLTGRMFIRRWRALLVLVIVGAMILLARPPVNYIGYAFGLFAALQFLFVLQETTTELATRIEDAFRGVIKEPAPQTAEAIATILAQHWDVVGVADMDDDPASEYQYEAAIVLDAINRGAGVDEVAKVLTTAASGLNGVSNPGRDRAAATVIVEALSQGRNR